MAGLGTRTWVAGEVVTAANVQGYLQDQTVMVFASATARTSAIASPSEGMITYLKDVDEIQVYSGSAWIYVGSAVAPGGLVLIKSQTIGTAVASVTVSNAFNSSYDNYKIQISGGVSSIGTNQLTMILGSTNTGYYYNFLYQFYTSAAGNALAINGNNVTAWSYTGAGNLTSITMDCDIFSPNLPELTSFRAAYFNDNASGHAAGYLNNTTQYTSFTITPGSGTLTGGTIYVYGYRK